MAQHHSPSSSTALLLVGDSDIARWPQELLPQLRADVPPATVMMSGHNGATLQDIIPHIETAIESLDSPAQSIILVVCAGENDIGNGIALDDTLSSFQQMLQTFFAHHSSSPSKRLIFLGPKIEPWLEDDSLSRKQYIKLSRALQRACSKHERSNDIKFVDCLTMFCGETAQLPGATLGGKAKAQPEYFCDDQLHLSIEGYKVWKQAVESLLSDLSIP